MQNLNATRILFCFCLHEGGTCSVFKTDRHVCSVLSPCEQDEDCRDPAVRTKTDIQEKCGCVSLEWLMIGLWSKMLAHVSHSYKYYIVYNILSCVWITGIQTKLPITGAGDDTVEMRPAEQSKEELISTSQKPPPSPAIDWSQPEIEDDDRCVTVVIHLLLRVSRSWRNQALLSPQYCRNVRQSCSCRLD